MEMSLEDIIKKKKINENGRKKFVPKTKQPLRKTINKPIFKDAKRIADARNKIIQKKRLKIVDARDKLVEINRKTVVDAREKLLLKKGVHDRIMHDIYGNGHISATPMRTKYAMLKQRPAEPAIPRMPEPIRVPRGYVDYDNMERMEEEEYAAATRLSRTVKNDISPYDSYDMPQRSEQPPPPPRRLDSWSSTKEPPFDPFDLYEVHQRSRRERRMSTDMLPSPPKGILRSTSTRQRSPEVFQRRYIPENNSHLSYEMRSRLETAPDPHASMGIFANPLKPSQGHSSSSSGYRIVVSNLHSSVTQSDIQELFEDIGELYDSRIVRPGVAEVIYKSIDDAEKAVETYHNRQLDGQPMKCLLVNPRSSNKPTAPAIRSSNSSSSSARLSSGKTPLEIDIDALHKVLFRRN